MKKVLLSIFSLAIATASFAQVSGVKITPEGATPADQITITIFPTLTCPQTGDAKSLDGATRMGLHSGVAKGGSVWQNVVGSGASDDLVKSGFELQANGTWTKTFVPAEYYGVAADVIDSLCFVINGGPAATPWDKEGKKGTTGACADFFVPFPISGAITSNKKVNNSPILASYASPNPAKGSTKIVVNTKGSVDGSVRIMNILGETVETLHKGAFTNGSQSFTWNTNSAKAGVYFYVVDAGSARQTRKIVVE